MQNKLLKYIGFAYAAGALVLGTDLVLTAIRRQQARLVILARDVSDRTAKQILDKSDYYKAEVLRPDCTMEELARAAGKDAPVAAMAVTDKGFAVAIRKSLETKNV